MTNEILPAENDERLKQRLIIRSRDGYAIISAYNPDTTAKNRRTSKRTRALEKLIIEAGFVFRSVTTILPNGDHKTEFILFEKFNDGFNAPGIMLAPFLEECRASNRFQCFTVHHDIEQFLRDKTFTHPLLKETKADYIKRRELFLDDLFEPPSSIGNWHVDHATSETSVVYANGSFLCIVSQLPDGTWQRAYGTIHPIGAHIKSEYAATREEAFSTMTPLNELLKSHRPSKPQQY